jgi:chorismate mutase/prephenate dehydratase
LVIGEDMNPPSGKDKTTILCSIKDKPGTLYELIEPFYRFNINMTKIESRPTKKKLWEYNFFIDFEGHFKDKKIGEVTDVLKSRTIMLKILGSYPKGQEFE